MNDNWNYFFENVFKIDFKDVIINTKFPIGMTFRRYLFNSKFQFEIDLILLTIFKLIKVN